MNIVVLVGRLGLDPEIRYLPSGVQTARLRLAVNDYWRDKATGERQERTHWFTVNAFARQAEICGRYLRKGSKILVRGTLEYREWTDREGRKRSVVEVRMQEMEMLDRRDADFDRGPAPAAAQPAASRPAAPSQPPAGDPSVGFDPAIGDDDDIPF